MKTHQTGFGTVETVESPNGDNASFVVLFQATPAGSGSLAWIGKTLTAAGHHVMIPALHSYDETWVNGTDMPVERSVRVAVWVLSAFRAEKRVLFGHFIGGLTAVKPTLPVGRLKLYEPMVMRALNPGGAVDTRERE